MIRVVFFRGGGGALQGFHLSGHAGAQEHGKDIVCAAVSSAAYMTVNTITDVLFAKPLALEAQDGDMRLELSSQDSGNARTVLEGFRLHMEELAGQYPKNIQVSFAKA